MTKVNQLRPDEQCTDDDDDDDAMKHSSPAAAAVEFARLVGRLKTTPRTGWVRRGVPNYESVADHSWRVAALSLLLGNSRDDDGVGHAEINVAKCMSMGLLHDLAECVMGDLCPQDNVSKEDKARMEQDAMSKIARLLERATADDDGDKAMDIDDGSRSSVEMLMSLIHEYEARESKESQAVKDLDLLDMIIQADEYEERFDMDLGEFFDGTPPSRFQTPALQKIAKEVHSQRLARQKQSTDTVDKEALSRSDSAFAAEYALASGFSSFDVANVVEALRNWETEYHKA